MSLSSSFVIDECQTTQLLCLLGLLYRNIGIFFSYIGNIGNIGSTIHPEIDIFHSSSIIIKYISNAYLITNMV